MSKLLNLVQHAPKRTAAVLTAVFAAIVLPATLLAWGPDRPTFTEQVPASYITFNSIKNNSTYGDERYFASVKSTDQLNTAGGWTDNQTVEPGKEYLVRVYVHNNAASNLNLVAKNVRASVSMPTVTGKSMAISNFITADNANPNKIWDDVNFKSDKDFNLVYVPGSATFHNNSVGVAPQGAALPDSIVTNTGALLGYDKLDGNMPGCNEYSGYVYFKVKPQFATETSDFTITKQVRKDGATDGFKESVDVKQGDKVNYRIEVKNTGNSTLKNINLKDKLPADVSLVPGTVKILNAANPNGASIQGGDNIVAGGVNIGSYTPGSNALVVFTAKVKDTLTSCGKNIMTNTAAATPEGQSPKEDTADVTASRECKPGEVPVTPVTALPQTGVDTGVLAFIGLGIAAAGAGYAFTSDSVRKLFRR